MAGAARIPFSGVMEKGQMFPIDEAHRDGRETLAIE
jgi:hypothetical protein